MVMRKQLSGELIGLDPQTRFVRVRFRKWWETGRSTEATATFELDPYALVTSAYRGTLRLSQLNPGQRVTLTYIPGEKGYPLAKALTVSVSKIHT